jgi:hypothetical protein
MSTMVIHQVGGNRGLGVRSSQASPEPGDRPPARGTDPLHDAVLAHLADHGVLARACRQALGGVDPGRRLEHRVRRRIHRDARFAARYAAALLGGGRDE